MKGNIETIRIPFIWAFMGGLFAAWLQMPEPWIAGLIVAGMLVGSLVVPAVKNDGGAE